METEKNEGLYAAVVTPMNKNGEVNISAIEKYANFLDNKKLQGVFICGSTGESLLLDTEERKRVAEAWMKHKGDLKVMVHVGSTSSKIAGTLANHAQEIGADVVSAMGPPFLPPRGVNELVHFNQTIAENAPYTPFYYYHVPSVSNVSVDMIQFLKEGRKAIHSLRGVKFTSYNLMEEQECIALDNNYFDILHGHDELFLQGMSIGARGGIGTSFNVTSLLFHKIIQAFDSDNISEAACLQAEANAFIRLMLNYENSIVSIKAILNIMGIECGPCRLPLRNLSIVEMKKLEVDLLDFKNII